MPVTLVRRPGVPHPWEATVRISVRISGSKVRRPAVGLAAAGLLAGAAFAAGPAFAAPAAGRPAAPASPAGRASPPPAAPPATAASAPSLVATSTLATTLGERLGHRTAGSYLDSAGKLVVTVTDADAADAVRASGAT